ncbi:MAG: sulfite oxidase heme-binding subunit YedZ, partial [Nitrososphaerales archaeon]
MRKVKFGQVLVHMGALVPLAWLIFDAATGRLSVNPIQDIEQRTGKYALVLLVLSLWCTPASILTGWSAVTRWRRPLGLYAFGYAALHFLAFIGLDYGFNFRFLWADVAGKRYIFVGLAALSIL